MRRLSIFGGYFSVSALLLLATLTIPAEGSKTHKLRGQIFAYKPYLITRFTRLTSVPNQEIFILKLDRPKNIPSFVKVVMTHLGASPLLNQGVLNNGAALELRGTRDKGCDEANPEILDRAEIRMKIQTTDSQGLQEITLPDSYQRSDFFAGDKAPSIRILSCYQVVTEGK